MILLRREVGDVLRDHRQAQGRTLREVSVSAAVSLGYLSEVERVRMNVESLLVQPSEIEDVGNQAFESSRFRADHFHGARRRQDAFVESL